MAESAGDRAYARLVAEQRPHSTEQLAEIESAHAIRIEANRIRRRMIRKVY